MKKSISILLFFVSFNIYSQIFEGKITYNRKVTNTDTIMWSNSMLEVLREKNEYYIKNGCYKSLTGLGMTKWQIYTNNNNRLYSNTLFGNAIVYQDASIKTDTLIKYELNRNVMTILGYQCDELIMTFKNCTEKFYYNSKLGVNYKLYNKHNLGNWNDYLNISKAIPLKRIIVNGALTIESIAIEIKAQKLGNEIFEIPKNLKLVTSPY